MYFGSGRLYAAFAPVAYGLLPTAFRASLSLSLPLSLSLSLSVCLYSSFALGLSQISRGSRGGAGVLLADARTPQPSGVTPQPSGVNPQPYTGCTGRRHDSVREGCKGCEPRRCGQVVRGGRGGAGVLLADARQ